MNYLYAKNIISRSFYNIIKDTFNNIKTFNIKVNTQETSITL